MFIGDEQTKHEVVVTEVVHALQLVASAAAASPTAIVERPALVIW